MKAAIHINNREHQQTHGAAMKAGLERHGITVEFAPYDEPQPCDIAVVWGWKQNRVITSIMNIVVMEAGCLGGRTATRYQFTSCGWNGLAGRGEYPWPWDGGRRWQRWAHLLRPWREDGDYALVCGQVRGDAALYGASIETWAQTVTDGLLAQGWRVVYRRHPLMRRAGDAWCPKGAEASVAEALADDLAGAGVVVTYNSTVGVEAALAGIPVVACDAGSMAWRVAAHDVDAPLRRPDRTDWCHRLAWTNYSIEEIRNGFAWDALRTVIPGI